MEPCVECLESAQPYWASTIVLPPSKYSDLVAGGGMDADTADIRLSVDWSLVLSGRQPVVKMCLTCEMNYGS